MLTSTGWPRAASSLMAWPCWSVSVGVELVDGIARQGQCCTGQGQQAQQQTALHCFTSRAQRKPRLPVLSAPLSDDSSATRISTA